MHELSIAYNLVEIVDTAARKENAAGVRVVRLRLGAMAGVVEEALRFSFPIAAQGTLVENAELTVETVAVKVFCGFCAAEQRLDAPFVFRCPTCGKPIHQLLQGREIEIESIEIEESENDTPVTAPGSLYEATYS